MTDFGVPHFGWDTRELAEHLGISERTARKYARIWPHHKVPGNRVKYRFLPGDVAQIRRIWFTPVNQPEPPTAEIRRLRHKRQAS